MAESVNVVEKKIPEDVVMGIDLGTTYLCVVLWRNGKAEVLINDQGKRTTPSFVAFTENERLVGDLAKDQVESNPKNTVYNTKRLIGRYCCEEDVKKDLRSFHFNVRNEHGRPIIAVESQGVSEMYRPEEISAIILRKLMARAQKVTGFPVRKAVITIPHNFNAIQRSDQTCCKNCRYRSFMFNDRTNSRSTGLRFQRRQTRI